MLLLSIQISISDFLFNFFFLSTVNETLLKKCSLNICLLEIHVFLLSVQIIFICILCSLYSPGLKAVFHAYWEPLKGE